MSTRGARWLRRLDAWASWAPSGRYTVIGDPVNEAARLTELAKDHPCRVVASGPTVEAASPDERAHWQPDAEVRLRGRDEVTRTWVRRL